MLTWYPVCFSNGDPLSYYVYAQALVKGDASGSMLRTPGYPLLLIATGVLHGHTLLYLLVLQTLMAVGLPPLVYATVRRVYPRAALPVGLATIGCLLPYGYMQSVMTETPFMFFVLLAIYAAVVHHTGGRTCFFYLALGACMVAVLIRLAASALFVVFLLAYGLSPRRRGRHLVCGVLLVAGVLLVNAWLHHRTTGYWGNHWTGFGLLYQNYFASGLYGDAQQPAFDPAMGPATTLMLHLMENYVTIHPEILDRDIGGAELAQQYIAPYKNRPAKELVAAMCQNPSLSYYALFQVILGGALTPPEADRLLVRVALEKWRADPVLLLKYFFINVKAFFWGPTTIYWFERDPYRTTLRAREWGLAPLAPPVTAAEGAAPELVKTLVRKRMGTFYAWSSLPGDVLHVWRDAFVFVRPFVFVIWACTWPWLLARRETRGWALLGLLIVGYSAAVVSLTAAVLDRVVFQTFLIELMLAGVGLWMLSDRLAARRARNPV